MANRFMIWKGNRVDVLNYNGGVGGYLGYNELYVDLGQDSRNGYTRIISFYSSTTGGERTGYIHSGGGYNGNIAYDSHTRSAYNNTYGNQFQVRAGRRCRIYRDTEWYDSIYGNNNDVVCISTGIGTAGSIHRDRIALTAYRRSGVWLTGGSPQIWGDTDILFGFPTTPTITSRYLP